MILLRRHLSAKPPTGALLIRDHPMARDLFGACLFSAGAGNGDSFLNGRIAATAGDLQWNGASGLACNSSLDTSKPTMTLANPTGITGWTLGCSFASPIPAASQVSLAYLISHRSAVLDSTLCFSTNAQRGIAYTSEVTVDEYSAVSGLVYTPNAINFAAVSVTPTAATVFLNGATWQNVKAHTVRTAWNTSPTLWRIGYDSLSANRYFAGTIHSVFLWRRSLELSEMRSMHANTYGMFWSPSNIAYSFGSVSSMLRYRQASRARQLLVA